MSSSVTKTLKIEYGDGSTYITKSGGMILDYSGLTADGVMAIIAGTSGNGYGYLNDTAKNAIFPNGTAHPTSMQFKFNTSEGSTSTRTQSIYLGSTQIWTQTNIGSQTGVAVNATSAQCSSITKGSDIYFKLYKSGRLGYSIVADYFQSSATFTRYDFSATAGTGVSSTSVTSNCVDGNAYGFDGDTVTYTCNLVSGATFDGWYKGSTRVSTSQTYTHTVNGSDLALTAKASGATQYSFSATAGTGVSNASASPTTGYNGEQIVFSCTLQSGATFDGWYNGSTRVSTSQTYTHTVSGANLTLEARATTTSPLSATYNGSELFTVQVSGNQTVTYNGSTIATITKGQSKTLNCSGKVMNSDVVIAGKTLKCNGKVMASDVAINYGSWRSLYQEVEYIENTGSSYIDTGVSGGNASFAIDMQVTQSVVWQKYFGGLYAGFVLYQYNISDKEICVSHNPSGSAERYVKNISGENRTLIEYDYSENVVYVDGSSLSTNFESPFTWGDSNVLVFTCASDPTNFGKMKLYHLTIGQDGVTTRDFYPVYRRSDGEIGLYDTINNVFYPNAGSGTFTKGADVNP